MNKFADINVVRQDIKNNMPLNELIALADQRYTKETGNACDTIEVVNDHLYKKRCDLDEHPVDPDGTRDSTPSFTICPQKELWYCFGCGASGDRFEYISRRFHVDHITSIHMAAEIQGMDLSGYMAELTEEEIIKESLFKENEVARQIAHDALLNSERALTYLKGRGITDESIEMFKLGYASPIAGDINQFGLIANSVALQLDRRDQFNDAILFPITDVNGRMRYFQSRPFKPLTGMKYIGGATTHPLYDETDRIFGFNIAKHQLYKNGGKLVGVEGATDTIACVQQDIVACGFLGTVVNQTTFDLLDKYHVTELILLLDGDKAGRDRSYKIAEKYLTINTHVRLRIAMMPEGYDPEEYINKYGSDDLKTVIEDAVFAVQYLIDNKWNEATTPTAKMSFIYDIQPYMIAIHDKIMRSIMVTHVASKLGLDPVQIEDYYTQSVATSTTGVSLYSPDGEEILLGQAIRDPDFITDLTMRFNDDDWYLLKHKHLFRILKNSEYKDIESLHTVAKNLNVDNIVTYDWLQKLYNKHGNVEFSLFDVEDKLIRRKSIDIMDKTKAISMDMTQDITLILDKATTDMYQAVHKKMDEKIFDAKQQVGSVMKLIHERMKDPNQIIGYEYGYGFKKVALATLGMQRKTLTIVAANQSVGKTQICENWAMYQSVVEKVPTLWFSLEMDSDRMTFRNLSIISGVQCTEMMTGNITMEQKQEVDKAAIMLEQAPFYLSERGHDLSEAIAIARRYVIKNKVKVIYIDYAQLQYVSDRKTDQRHRELGWISKGWKQFAQDMDVAVVLVSQLSKEALTAEIARAEHGAGSYELAQDSDNYITLKEKSEDEINQRGIEHGNITCNISKNRMGEKEILIDIYADRVVHRMREV